MYYNDLRKEDRLTGEADRHFHLVSKSWLRNPLWQKPPTRWAVGERKGGIELKLLRWLDEHFEETIMVAILWTATAVSTLQVIMRRGFKYTLAWPEEFNRYLFIWFSYLALSYAVRFDCHTRIDLVETLVPSLKKPFSYICDIGFAFFCLYMIKPGWNVVSQLIQSWQTSSAMNLPMYLVYLSLFCGVILSLIRLVQKYVKKIILLRNKKREEAQ